MDHEDRMPRSVNCARTKNLNGEMTMTTEVKMSPQAEQAFTRILALRAATRETGTVTKKSKPDPPATQPARPVRRDAGAGVC